MNDERRPDQPSESPDSGPPDPFDSPVNPPLGNMPADVGEMPENPGDMPGRGDQPHGYGDPTGDDVEVTVPPYGPGYPPGQGPTGGPGQGANGGPIQGADDVPDADETRAYRTSGATPPWAPPGPGAPGPAGPYFGPQGTPPGGPPPEAPGGPPPGFPAAPPSEPGFTVDPFGAPPGSVDPNAAVPAEPPASTVGGPGGKKKWLIPIAAVLAVALIAAGVWFFLLRGDDGDSTADGGPSASTTPDRETSQSADPSSSGDPSASADPTESEPASSEPSSPPSSASTSASTGEPGEIAGSYEVNGVISSFEGPQAGALGGGKKAGDQTFGSPQTWTIAECTDDECTLTVEPGGASTTLTPSGDTWTGEMTAPFACDVTGQNVTDATISVVINGDGTGQRTLTATCAAQVTETSDLTLTKK